MSENTTRWPVLSIPAWTVNSALKDGLDLIAQAGYMEESRNGKAYVAPGLVVTSYFQPQLRVMFSPDRDCNPFFHFFESLWMLAGRADVEFPAYFSPNMRNFSVDGRTFNAPYGYRWRCYSMHSGVWMDQLMAVIYKLTKNPNTRQAVINIWDPELDLVDSAANAKDRACNLNVVFSPRPLPEGGFQLDMTVSNRSNDMIWGAYGANAVQFATLQEFVAQAVGMKIGVYNQVSANAHVYSASLYGEKLWNALTEPTDEPEYPHGWKPRNLDSEYNDYYLPADLRAQHIGPSGWFLAPPNAEEDRKSPDEVLHAIEYVVEHLIRGLSNLEQQVAASATGAENLWWSYDYLKKSFKHLLNSMGGGCDYDDIPILEFQALPMALAHRAYKAGFKPQAIQILEEADKELNARYGQGSVAPLSPAEPLVCEWELSEGEFDFSLEGRCTHIKNDWLRSCAQWIMRRITPI